jgi:2-polyprenyl-6-methoxyphenol hydroxylase-like FAD-dependent oxidoreductase
MEGIDIGIVGAGVAGLHLALYLQKHAIPVTLYAEKTAEQQRTGRLPNTAAHWGNTRVRERELGVNHWDGEQGGKFGNFCFYFYIGIEPPLIFRGDFIEPGITIDQRIYLAKLLEDFEERGGSVVIGTLQANDLEALSEKHDLVVVSSGRGSLTQLFPRVPERSPYMQPQRLICTGIYHGIAQRDPMGVGLHLSPGHGELFEMPYFTFDGPQMALFFELVPGGDLEPLMQVRYDEDPKGFEATVLQALKDHFPTTLERLNTAEFGVTRPQDVLQGSITPTVRRAYARLDNGKFVLAMGDVHVVNDPLMGQGSNAASHAAFVVGQAIIEDDLAFDERWCRRTEACLWDYVGDVTEWNNYMLQVPPPMNVVQVLVAASQNKAVANVFADNFRTPGRNWDMLASPERTIAFLQKYGCESPLLNASESTAETR